MYKDHLAPTVKLFKLSLGVDTAKRVEGDGYK